MTSLILGFLVGLLFVCILALIRLGIDSSIPYDAEGIATVITVILSIAVVIICMFAGVNIERNGNSKAIVQYVAEKQLIESSLNNDELTGFERVELVKQASEANSALIGLQYDCRQWYGFTIDDAVLELEPITFDGGDAE